MAQTIIEGIEGIQGILDAHKYLLVCGRSFRSLEISRYFKPAATFDGWTPNPLYEQVCEGVELFRKSGCDSIVAVGGGSAIDVAKCIKLYAKCEPGVNYLEQPMQDTGIPLIAVPTTAGSGSESTRHAVIYYKSVKQSISHPSIVPDYAVLEPSVLAGLPLYQRKSTMLDALCQSLESWWSVNSTAESVGYSRKALELLLANWRQYIKGSDAAVLSAMMLGSNYAGRAINITATTAPHAMSYKLAALYGFSHGHAVALSLPEVWEYMIGHLELCNDARGQDYLRKMLASIPISSADFRGILAELAMEYPKARERDAEIEMMVNSVNPLRLKNSPVFLSQDVLRSIYGKIVL